MKDLLFEQRRTQALTVSCTYCGAHPGEECIGVQSRMPIQHQPAHLARVKAAHLASLARQPEKPANPQTVADRAREYGTRGWFPAQNPGRCGTCWNPYEPGTPVLAIGPHNLRAECCADGAEETP